MVGLSTHVKTPTTAADPAAWQVHVGIMATVIGLMGLLAVVGVVVLLTLSPLTALLFRRRRAAKRRYRSDGQTPGDVSQANETSPGRSTSTPAEDGKQPPAPGGPRHLSTGKRRLFA